MRVNFPLVVKKLMVLEASNEAEAVTWSPDGSRIAATGDFSQKLMVWDGASGRKIAEFPGPGGMSLRGYLQFANGGSQLVFDPPQHVSDTVGLSVWDIASGKVVANVGEPEPSGVWPHNAAMGFCVSQRKHYLAVASDGTDFYRNTAIYDTSSWKRLHWWKVPEDPFSISCSDDGKYIFLGSFFGSVSIIEVDGRAAPKTFRVEDGSAGYGVAGVSGLAAAPDGQYFVVAPGSGGTAPDKPVNTPAEVAKFKAFVNSQPRAIVLRVSDGKQVAGYVEPDSGINPNAIAWDPKGRFIAFIDMHHRLVLWRPFAPKPSYQKIFVPGAYWFAVSPDGDRIVVPSISGMVVFTVAENEEESSGK